MYKININKRAFSNIVNNNKKIEGRLLKGIFSKVHIGDIFTFYHDNQTCNVKVIKINCYNNFYDMLSNENLKNLLPYCNNVNEGLDLYNKIYKNNINKHKVLAIHFNLLNPTT
jgi:ASC-1-like (ASCH) protein